MKTPDEILSESWRMFPKHLIPAAKLAMEEHAKELREENERLKESLEQVNWQDLEYLHNLESTIKELLNALEDASRRMTTVRNILTEQLAKEAWIRNVLRLQPEYTKEQAEELYTRIYTTKT
jgi:hypothetical protein